MGNNESKTTSNRLENRAKTAPKSLENRVETASKPYSYARPVSNAYHYASPAANPYNYGSPAPKPLRSCLKKTSEFSNYPATTKDLPSLPKNAGRRDKNVDKMAQNIHLVWMDNNIEESTPDCRHTISQLRAVVNTLRIFKFSKLCFGFLQEMHNEKACVIISGGLGRDMVPIMHKMDQVHSIFIFCARKEHHEQWAKEYSKIRGVYTDIVDICKQLKISAQQCEQDSMPISIMLPEKNASNGSVNRLPPSFVQTQILKEILLTIDFKGEHITEFIQLCNQLFKGNEEELENIRVFERKYYDETPVWWYSIESFLYPMLNRALREIDANNIIKMGFFIKDLHRQLEKLHKKQYIETRSTQKFEVYRGQGMPKSDFEQLQKSINGLISFNNFLSTSESRDIALPFAKRGCSGPNMVSILFFMLVDPSQSTAPFASVNDLSPNDHEDEILFSTHTVFRIDGVKLINKYYPYYAVNLTLTTNDDEDLCGYADYLREQTCPYEKGWYRLCSVLLLMGQPESAEELCETLIEQTNDKREQGRFYQFIGMAKDDVKEYQDAITYYKKACEIFERNLSPIDPVLSNCYNYIGNAYISSGDYDTALSYHEKDLEVKQTILGRNHADVAAAYNNIGLAYDKKRNYSKARSYFQQAVDLAQRSLPLNHPYVEAYRGNLKDMERKL